MFKNEYFNLTLALLSFSCLWLPGYAVLGAFIAIPSLAVGYCLRPTKSLLSTWAILIALVTILYLPTVIHPLLSVR